MMNLSNDLIGDFAPLLEWVRAREPLTAPMCCRFPTSSRTFASCKRTRRGSRNNRIARRARRQEGLLNPPQLKIVAQPSDDHPLAGVSGSSLIRKAEAVCGRCLMQSHSPLKQSFVTACLKINTLPISLPNTMRSSSALKISSGWLSMLLGRTPSSPSASTRSTNRNGTSAATQCECRLNMVHYSSDGICACSTDAYHAVRARPCHRHHRGKCAVPDQSFFKSV
jgi:hypothetical protein